MNQEFDPRRVPQEGVESETPAQPAAPHQPAAPAQPPAPAQPAAPYQPPTPAQPAAPYQPPAPYQPAAPYQVADSKPSIFDRLLQVMKFQTGAFAEIAADPRSVGQALIVVALASTLGLWRFCPGFSNLSMILLSLGIMIAGPISLVTFAALINLSMRLMLRGSQRDMPEFLASLRAILFAWAPIALGTTIPTFGLIVGIGFAIALQVFAFKDLYKILAGDAAMLWAIASPMVAIISFLNVGLLFGLSAGYASFLRAMAVVNKLEDAMGSLGGLLDLLDLF